MKLSKELLAKLKKLPKHKVDKLIKSVKKKELAGHQISPKLFSILLDKLLNKRAARRKPAIKKKIIAESTPEGFVVSEKIYPKSDIALKHAADAEKRMQKILGFIEEDKPKLIEEKKSDEIVLYNGPKKVTITEQEYNNFMKHHQNIILDKENEKKMTAKQLKDYKLKVDFDKIDKAAENYADKETDYNNLKKYIKLKNEDLKENDRILIKGNRRALLDKIDEKLGIDFYGSIYDNYVNTEWNKIHPNTPLPQEPIIEEVKEEKDNKEPIILSPRHAPATPQKVAQGLGAKNIMAHDGLDNFQIDKIMKKYPQYLGCIAHDQIKSLIIPKIKPRSIGCFVINTDPASKGGQHWQAVYFDGKKDYEIDFYDSFGDPPDKTIMQGVKEIADKLDCDTYLKFKQNCIKQQDDRTANCGFFCVKFLIDRINGKHFKHASGFNDHVVNAARAGEKEINHFKHQVGFGPWSYIKSFANKAVNVGKEIVDRVKLAASAGRTDAPPAVRNLLSKYGEETIRSIKVGREPVNSVITGILNAVSGGKLEENKKALGYDKIYHLFLIITLSSGHSFKIERNETVSVSGPSLSSGSQSIDCSLKGKTIKLSDFINNGSAENANFWRYDSVSGNCQNFCRDMLSRNGLLTNELSKFIFQDAEKLMENSPLAVKIAKGVTDLGHKIHILIHGRNKYKRRIKRKYNN